MRCCALGRHVAACALEEENIVVLYFCTGRSSLGGTGGMLYLMKDALIVKVGHRAQQLVKRLEILVK